jgi:ABC-2 type transport system permease protein
VGALMGALLRSELRKTFSIKLWWVLLAPVVLLSILLNLFGGVVTAALPTESGDVPLVLGSLAYTVGFTSVFAALHGCVAAAGEFRHRTITTTYVTAAGRGAVLLAKMASSAAIGVLYAVATVLVGVLAGLAGQAGTVFPAGGPLLAVAAIGIVVAALWAMLGAALGTVISNQVSVVVTALVYMLLGETLLALLLNRADSELVPQLTPYLPVNAGEVALYEIPADEIFGQREAGTVVEFLAGVTTPPPWWGALLVLAAWTAAVAATAWVVAGRRDVT